MITLKKLSIHTALSEETTAFTAGVLFNGVLIGFAANTGKGGCTDVRPALGRDESKYPVIRAAFVQADAWAKTQPDKVMAASGLDHDAKHDCIGSYVDEIVDAEVSRRERAAFIGRNLRSATGRGEIIGYREGADGEMTIIQFPDNAEGRQSLHLTRPSLIDLSGLTAAEAVAKADSNRPL